MASDSQCLVMGAAFRLSVAQIRVFVDSLRKHFSGPVKILVTSVSESVLAYLAANDITPVYFDCPHWMAVHIQLARYIRYAEILRGASHKYESILLTDVSDVLFQGHPFAGAPAGDLLFFQEQPGRTIGQCPSNSKWMREIYGPKVLAHLKDRAICCSGTTIGTHAAILHYLQLLLSHAKPDILAKLAGFWGHDQAIHNYLLHTGALPQARVLPNGQHVYTLGFVPDQDIVLGPGGTILTPQRDLCPIVHQYNYKPAALAHVQAAFPQLLRVQLGNVLSHSAFRTTDPRNH